jgi:hypothetical protein
MHMVNRSDDLVHVVFDPSLVKVVSAALNSFVHVHVHELKNQGQSASGFVIENFVQRDDIGVRRKSFKSLNFSQVVDLPIRLLLTWSILAKCAFMHLIATVCLVLTD